MKGKLIVLLSIVICVLFTPNAYADTIPIAIDIKPFSCPNSINLKSRGVVPVQIEGWSIDVTIIDPDTVEFAGASPVHWNLEDVDNDGWIDLIFHFKTQELDLLPSDTEATLTGETYYTDTIEGTSSVNIVPK